MYANTRRPTARFTRAAAALTTVAVLGAGCGAGDGTDYDVTLTPDVGEDDVATWPLQVEMSAEETLTIEPAGDVSPDAGHFHVMLTGECVEPGEVIPSDAEHRHFGDASTTATLAELPPGDHELCLQAGDGAHTALDASHVATVTVGDVTEEAWRREVTARCADLADELDPFFEEFFEKWEAELEAGAGPDHPEADAIVDDWYAAVAEITPRYEAIVASALALPAPENLGEDVAQASEALANGLAQIEEMAERADPEFLFGPDSAFPLTPLFDQLRSLDIGVCEGSG